MSLVLTICHIIRLYKCEHCTLTYSNKITLVWFFHFFLGGRWFSKILGNICGWYVKILIIPYKGRWVVWKRPKTPLRNIKMAPNWYSILLITIKLILVNIGTLSYWYWAQFILTLLKLDISEMIDICKYWYLESLALAIIDPWNYLYSACLI